MGTMKLRAVPGSTRSILYSPLRTREPKSQLNSAAPSSGTKLAQLTICAVQQCHECTIKKISMPSVESCWDFLEPRLKKLGRESIALVVIRNYSVDIFCQFWAFCHKQPSYESTLLTEENQ